MENGKVKKERIKVYEDKVIKLANSEIKERDIINETIEANLLNYFGKKDAFIMDRNSQLKEIKEKLGRYTSYYLDYYNESNFRICSMSEIISEPFIRDMEKLGFKFVSVSIDNSLHVYALFRFREMS